jgi:predicted transcriptional regulator
MDEYKVKPSRASRGVMVVLNDEEKKLLHDLAAHDDRSASAVVRVALRDYAIRIGMLKNE